MTSKAEQDVLAERQRQQDKLGWIPEHDDTHSHNEMGLSAACYAIADPMYLAGYNGQVIAKLWPWDVEWWKPKAYRENLVRAGALIIAEIERLDRQESEDG